MRIYFQNINGLKAASDFSHVQTLAITALGAEIDVLGLAETNIDWRHREVNHTIFRQFNQVLKPCTLATATTNIRYNTYYKPGGTCLLAHGNWQPRCRRLSDPMQMGRWSTLLIRGRHRSKLAIISAYRVCNQDPSQAGGRTAYMQQWQMLRTQHPNCTPDPRRQFFIDLKAEIARLTTEDYEVVVMLDANESMYDRNSNLLQFVQESQLTDLHLLRHSAIHSNPPGTYQRGSKRLDYIFGTRLIANCTARAGISAYHEYFSSDHRGLYVDLDVNQFFGGQPTPLDITATRLLHSHRIQHAMAYRSHILEYSQQHKLTQRSEALEQLACTDPSHPSIPKMLNGIIEDLTRGMLAAEKKCGAHHSHPWSPTLVNARRRVRFWRIWLSELRTGRSFSNERAQLASEAQWEPPEIPLPPTRRILIRHLRQAKSHLSECERKAVLLREEFLEERAAYWAKVLDQKKSAVLAGLHGVETIQRVFYRFRTMLRKHQSGGGLASLKVPITDDNGVPTTEYKWLHDPDEIGPRLIQRNLNHFSQARGPFTQGPVLECLGRNAAHGQHGIQKALALTDITPATKALLGQLQGTPLPRISNTITGADLRQKFQRWSESTSTSPSGVHLGHYKSLLLLDIKKPDSAPAAQLAHQPDSVATSRATQDRSIGDQITTHDDSLTQSAPAFNSCAHLFDVMGHALTASFKSGHVADRWLTVHNTMLEKDPGDPRIDRLRVIHIFDAVWNAGLGILWSRRLMPQCERHSALHEGQWGSLQGKKAIECVCIKQFTYEIAAFTRTDLVTFDNDAKSCYDRIVMAYALACCIHLGLPEMTAVAFGKFLDEARYHVKTVLGVSTDSYSHGDDDKDLHGPGQGSQPGPCLWAIECSQIMAALTKHFTGVDLCTPDRELQIAQALQGFVDDVANASSKFQETLHHFTEFTYTEEQSQQFLHLLVQEATEMAQWWETLLWHSGGQLEFRKCFLYILHWTFDPSGIPLPATVDQLKAMGISVSLTNSDDNTTTEFRHMDCSVATRTLGCMVAPNGSSKLEVSHLAKKGHRLGVALAVNKISRKASRTFYRSIFLPSMTYSLPSTHLSYKDCQTIHKSSTGQLLNSLGFPRNFPHALTFAPRELGGVGFTHLWVEQGCQHLHSILLPTLRGQPNILRKTLVILLKWAHLYSGFIFHPLQDVDQRIPYLPSGWFQVTRDFLAESDAYLELPENEFPTPRLLRTGDSNLMETACRGKWTPRELMHINNCRLFLKVRFLSEVCTLLGDELYAPCLTGGSPTLSQPPATELWPIQQCPGETQWALFRRFLRHTYCRHHRTNKLKDTLDSWLPHSTTRLWPAYYNITNDQVLIRCNGGTYLRYHTSGRGVTALYDRTIEVPIYPIISQLPANCFPTRVNWPRRLCAIPPVFNYDGTYDPGPPPPGLIDSFQHQHPHFEASEFVVQETGQQQLCSTFNTAVTLPEVYFVCDGGSRPPTGSFGWVIGDEHDEWLKANGPAMGWPMSSFRAEAWSIWNLLSFLRHLLLHYGFQGNPIQILTIHTDSLSFIQRFQELQSYGELWYSSIYMRKDIDIFTEIFATLRTFPYYIQFEHVPGHQDNEVSYYFLSRPAQLNVQADLRATAALDRQPLGHRPTIPWLPNTKVRLVTAAHGPQTGDELSTLRKLFPGKRLASYFHHKFGWNDAAHQLIDWVSFEQATAKTEISRTFLAKLLVGWLPTNSRLSRYEPISAHCPNCPCDETQTHLYTCRSYQCWRDAFRKKIDDTMRSLYTEPSLHNHILQCIDHLLISPRPEPPAPCPDDDLNDYGAMLLFRGFLPRGWSVNQTAYLADHPHITNQKHPPPPWAPTMISHLWYASKDLWFQRNQTVHKHTNEDSPHTRRRLENMVRQLYRAGNTLNHIDRAPFEQPLSQRLASSSTAELRDWMTVMGPVVAAGRKRQTNQQHLHTPDIRRFFPTIATHKSSCGPRTAHPRHYDGRLPPQQDIRAYFTFLRHSTSNSITNTTGDNNHPS